MSKNMTPEPTKNADANRAAASEVQPWGVRVTEKNLSRALQIEKLQSGKEEMKNVKHFCVWFAIAAAEAPYKPPCLDLGVGALDYLAAPILTTIGVQDQKLFNELREMTTSLALEAAGEFSDVLKKHHLRLLDATEAWQKKFTDQEAANKLATELSRKVRELSTPDERTLNGREFLQIIQYHRGFPPDQKQPLADEVLIDTPPKKEKTGKNNKKVMLSGTLSARAGMTRLLKDLGIFNDDNLTAAMDWGLNYGFGHFLRIKDTEIRKLILSGTKVHRKSARVPTTEETAKAAAGETKQLEQKPRRGQKTKPALEKPNADEKGPEPHQKELL